MSLSKREDERVVRFESYELDVGSRELRRGQERVRLQGQPFAILVMMLERPGQVVTREEFVERLWPDGTFVDFEHSLNTAVKRGHRRWLSEAACVGRARLARRSGSTTCLKGASGARGTGRELPRGWSRPLARRNCGPTCTTGISPMRCRFRPTWHRE